MPRNNRSTVKIRRFREQRSKRRIGDLAYVRSMNPHADERERGSADTIVVGTLVVLISAVAVVLGLLWFAPPADARAVMIDPHMSSQFHSTGPNPFIYVEHSHRRWYYAERYDTSEWMVTRCRYEDSRNCYFNAKKRGDGKGRSFINLKGRIVYVNTAMQP